MDIQVSCTWSSRMAFTGHAGEHTVKMDTPAPLGEDSATTPKQLLLLSVCGCTAMDVVALLKKHKQSPQGFAMEASAELTETHPRTFKSIELKYQFHGDSLDIEILKKSVDLSMTLYCGVSAMVAKACPIRYTVWVGDTEIHKGEAAFQ